MMLCDLSSLSNPHQVLVTHLDWDFTVDFDKRVLTGTAVYSIERKDTGAKYLDLDTSSLTIKGVSDNEGQSLVFTLHPMKQKHLGRKLSIELLDSTSQIAIEYETTPESSAAQWLPPSQTAGKKYPYVFTQGQAIHVRSLVPCQDMPGVKMTFAAKARVPAWAVCVFSAVLKKEYTENLHKVYIWEQQVKVSSYLIAFAVGNLERRTLSERCAVWSEPEIVAAAQNEFIQTEDFLKIAEDLAGSPYVWGRYDLLCLPPSFPYGGMENPCMTFVTPTLLAGDRSLADVVAHEIAHSWTGNLVTNATWDHFWLNEGWTTWFQRKIMTKIHKNDKFLDFDAIGGYKTLQETCAREMPAKYQSLVLNIGDEDPDDAYSSIAYEKGFNLLMALEKRVGKDSFESFFKAYVNRFSSKTLTSEDFKAFFMKHFEGNKNIEDFDWDTWLYSPGMPPEEPTFDRSLAKEPHHLADVWLAVDRHGRMLPSIDIRSWSSHQVVCFLNRLQELVEDKPLKVSTLNAIHKQYEFASSTNAEILFRICMLSVASEDEGIMPVVLHFVTSQGRMKYVRPLYRLLFRSKMGGAVAKRMFLENKDIYHPICAKMIASDLLASEKGETVSFENAILWTTVGAAVVGILSVIFTRRKR